MKMNQGWNKWLQEIDLEEDALEMLKSFLQEAECQYTGKTPFNELLKDGLDNYLKQENVDPTLLGAMKVLSDSISTPKNAIEGLRKISEQTELIKKETRTELSLKANKAKSEKPFKPSNPIEEEIIALVSRIKKSSVQGIKFRELSNQVFSRLENKGYYIEKDFHKRDGKDSSWKAVKIEGFDTPPVKITDSKLRRMLKKIN